MQDLNIGKKVQEYRNMRQMSLRQLAAKSNSTASMISQIENKGVNPSINTLKEIAIALNIPLFTFFQDDVVPDKLIVRKGQNKILGDSTAEVSYKLLTPDTRGLIEFCLMEIPPNSATSTEAHEHTGEETAFVVEGAVEIHINGQKEELRSGDSIRIPAFTRHLWNNKSKKNVSVVFAVTPPSF